MVAATSESTRPSLRPELRSLVESGEAEAWDAQEILSWSVENFHPRMALSASFGAAEGMALLHMLHQIEPATRVFVIDTGRLPQETHDLIDRVRDRYDKPIEVLFPDSSDVEELVRSKGMNLFYESQENRKSCCHVRKVVPLRRYLGKLEAYVTGLRRDQSAARSETPKLEIDRGNGGLVKINPIADGCYGQVWNYVGSNDIPVNRLHAKGYPSVGCAPCTRAVQPGEDPRSGRWWWESDDTRECGIHVSEEEQGSGI